MKKLELEQMENVQGGTFDCSKEAIYGYTAGAAVGGAVFFGIGGLIAGYVALSGALLYCAESVKH